MTKQTEALKLALEALENHPGNYKLSKAECAEYIAVEDAIWEALAEQPAQDNIYGYAKYLAEAMFNRHFASDEHYASGRVVWGVNDTVIGILRQIDDMVANMVRRLQQEPVAEVQKVWTDPSKATVMVMHGCRVKVGQHLYTSPPAQRKPLTDDEIQECWYKAQGDDELFARAIEAAHGIKGDA